MKAARGTMTVGTIGLIAVVLGFGLRQWTVEQRQGSSPPREAPTVRMPPKPEVVANPHLEWAEKECEKALDEYLKALDGFFKDAKKGTPEFANWALGWRSKWYLIKDYLPYASGENHREFIRSKFEEHLFKPADLESIVEQVARGYVTHIQSVENQMLVKIRADVADLPDSFPLVIVDDETLKERYAQALQGAMERTSSNLRADVATEVVAIITGEVLTQVAVRLGVSAGILGTGAATGWATLGVGVAVGVAVDYVVSSVWEWWADPKGDIARELDGKLDELQRMIVEGADGTPGLRSRLKDFARERSGLRRAAVMSLLTTQGGVTP